ncbi:hypothetical protein HDU67_004920 [Dinochytrium kinnereticum]|nr:hypothetical protein HDU67_004920 [Dinochytrium kinnereticum]
MAHFQGGPYFEVLSTSPSSPQNWKISSKLHVKQSYEKDVKGYCLTCEKSVSIELCLSDLNHNKRRFFLTTASKTIKQTALHVSLPMHILKRGIWTNLCIDLQFLISETFRGQTFRTLDFIALCGTFRLRKVFTLKNRPCSYDEYDNDLQVTCFEDLPKTLQFGSGVDYATQLLSPDRLKWIAMQENNPKRVLNDSPVNSRLKPTRETSAQTAQRKPSASQPQEKRLKLPRIAPKAAPSPKPVVVEEKSDKKKAGFLPKIKWDDSKKIVNLNGKPQQKKVEPPSMPSEKEVSDSNTSNHVKPSRLSRNASVNAQSSGRLSRNASFNAPSDHEENPTAYREKTLPEKLSTTLHQQPMPFEKSRAPSKTELTAYIQTPDDDSEYGGADGDFNMNQIIETLDRMIENKDMEAMEDFDIENYNSLEKVTNGLDSIRSSCTNVKVKAELVDGSIGSTKEEFQSRIPAVASKRGILDKKELDNDSLSPARSSVIRSVENSVNNTTSLFAASRPSQNDAKTADVALAAEASAVPAQFEVEEKDSIELEYDLTTGTYIDPKTGKHYEIEASDSDNDDSSSNVNALNS